MTRLYVFVEGQTEQTYADTALKKHLAAFGVYMLKPVLIASARRHGCVHRGGGRSYLTMKNDIIRLLRQEKDRDVFFTTMIDLYALPSGFPGMGSAITLQHLPYQRIAELEERFVQDIDDPAGLSRFIPHIQLHEFETLLLCQPRAFSSFFENCDKQVRILESSIGDMDPELIDDGEATAPSKRIINVFPDYRGAKTTAGPLIADEIGLETIRNKCPHFNAWLEKLESLAS